MNQKDRELMQMALDVIQSEFATGGQNLYDPDTVIEALRDRLAQPEPEPVAYTGNGTAGRENMTAPTGYFFQIPPKRKWVGLTRNEAMEIINSLVGQDWMYAVDAIEAKLKEKNT